MNRRAQQTKCRHRHGLEAVEKTVGCRGGRGRSSRVAAGGVAIDGTVDMVVCAAHRLISGFILAQCRCWQSGNGLRVGDSGSERDLLMHKLPPSKPLQGLLWAGLGS